MTNIPRDEPVFAISVVSRMIGIHQQTLRSYERLGLVRPARSPGNTRLYSQRDVEHVQHVLRLMKQLGVNVAGAQAILNMKQQIEQLQRELAETRAMVEQLRRGPEAEGVEGEARGE